MKKYFLIIILIFKSTQVLADTKHNIIKNLKKIENVTFNFEQNINGKTENGKCIIQYPKKIYCKYNLPNKKILVSNGSSLVIKTMSSYYLYPLKKTPLNFILDKNFLIEKIDNNEERIVDDKFVNFSFVENENEINLFFDKKSLNLIGWQTKDLYQNLSITYLSSINLNKRFDINLFKIPERN
jgi:outer membrane lipoprotein-sorting protein